MKYCTFLHEIFLKILLQCKKMHFWQSLEKFSTLTPKKNNLTVKKRVFWSKFSILRVKQFNFCVRIVTVCDLGSGARCLISLQCSFEPSWFGCMIATLHVLSYTLLNTLRF